MRGNGVGGEIGPAPPDGARVLEQCLEGGRWSSTMEQGRLLPPLGFRSGFLAEALDPVNY
jgi:hypothetical protein